MISSNLPLSLQFDAPPDSFKKTVAAPTQPPSSTGSKDIRSTKGVIVKKTEKPRKKKGIEREDKELEKKKEEEEEGEGEEKQRKPSREKLERLKSSEAVTPSTPDDELPLLPLLEPTADEKEAEVMEDLRKAEDSLAVINRQAEHEEQKVTTMTLDLTQEWRELQTPPSVGLEDS